MEITEPLEALMADLSPEVDFAQDDLEILDDNDFSLSAEEAIHGLDSVKWKEAMQLEIDALLKNGNLLHLQKTEISSQTNGF